MLDVSCQRAGLFHSPAHRVHGSFKKSTEQTSSLIQDYTVIQPISRHYTSTINHTLDRSIISLKPSIQSLHLLGCSTGAGNLYSGAYRPRASTRHRENSTEAEYSTGCNWGSMRLCIESC